jgi:hypothetical protein
MAPATVSVALCTYNGAAYLGEQLDSMVHQSRLPDELVVTDDGSTDGTVVALQSFIPEAPFPVRLYRNERRLGYAKNFERAIRLCTGDLIALSDQDDVWTPQKLARLEAALEAHPNAGLVCSDAEIVDRDLRPINLRLTESIGLKPEERELVSRGQALSVLLKRNFAMGASTMFRAACRSDILPIPANWPHDWWIALVIALRAQVRLIDEPLLLYRQHGANAIGIPEEAMQTVGDLMRSSVHPRSAQFVRQAEQWEAALGRIGTIAAEGPSNISVHDVAGLRAQVRHLRSRAGLPAHRLPRVPIISRELANRGYHRYSAGIASAVKDLFVQLGPVAEV